MSPKPQSLGHPLEQTALSERGTKKHIMETDTVYSREEQAASEIHLVIAREVTERAKSGGSLPSGENWAVYC